MPKVIWTGEFYRRSGGTYRSRRSGEIITSKPRVIKRSGKRNLIILPKGAKVLGVEETKKHYSGKDKPPVLKTSMRVLNKTRVRSRTEQKAMFARMKRGR